ncbi:MAG TPA: DMT family transporter [bacterium]|nr:DMT family transporter [bacterium]
MTVPERHIRRGQVYALAAIVIWSTNFIIGRELRDALTPGTIAAFRALVAGVPMGVWILARRGWPAEGRRQIGPMVGLGLLGIVTSQYMTYLALHWSLATNVIILNAASPLVTATIAVLVGAAPFSPGLFRGLAISVAGAFLVTAFGATGGARLEADPGALLVIATMVTWGFYNLGVQRLSLTLSPLVVTSGAMLAGSPFLIGVVALEHPPHLWAAVVAHLPVLVYLAVGPSAVAYACWSAAVRDLGADYAMLFNNLLPVFGMVLGATVLHERIALVQIGASALIIAGILIAFRSLTAGARSGAAA